MGRNYRKYKACVLTQKDQLDALDARKQKMTKEGAFYRSYALLKYAILNKVARLNSTSDTLQKFIGGCMNTQKLQKPHKTEKACDKAGNCEWVNTIPQIEEKIDEAFPDDKEKAECEKERVREFKTYKKFGIFPIKTEELQEHLTSARVLWLKKHLSKTKTRGAPRQQCADCDGKGTRIQEDGKQVKCPKMADGNFLGWWPDTNDTKYNIDYDPTVEELQDLVKELNCDSCADVKMPENNEQDNEQVEAEKAEEFRKAFIKKILEHHGDDHRHVMNEAGRPRGDSNASNRTSNTQGSVTTTASDGSFTESCAEIVTDAKVTRRPFGELDNVIAMRTSEHVAAGACMEMDGTLSPSKEFLGRRRLTHGIRTPPVLAALMEEIEEAERKYRLRH